MVGAVPASAQQLQFESDDAQKFQSPHGRGGSCILHRSRDWGSTSGAGGFNPLMVGAVPASRPRPRRRRVAAPCFNPLMVGAVPASRADEANNHGGMTRFQSPHGRGGSCIPTPPRRPRAAGWVSIPSWSGRFLHRTSPRRSGSAAPRFQSPHGRGGSCIMIINIAPMCLYAYHVSIPSWSGRFLHPGPRRATRAGLSRRFQSPHGRGGSCILNPREQWPNFSSCFNPLMVGAVPASCEPERGRERAFRVFQSPHGRGGSCIMAVLFNHAVDILSFNPLMVGAVPASWRPAQRQGQDTPSFNPLMVGAVPASRPSATPTSGPPAKRFQSPHGRGGSCISMTPSTLIRTCSVSIPSWSGRFLHRWLAEVVCGQQDAEREILICSGCRAVWVGEGRYTGGGMLLTPEYPVGCAVLLTQGQKRARRRSGYARSGS